MSATLKKVRQLCEEIYDRASREAYGWLHSLPRDEMQRGWREAIWPVIRDQWPPCEGCPIDLSDEERTAYFRQLDECPPSVTYEAVRAEIAAINRFRETLEAERLAKVGINGKN